MPQTPLALESRQVDAATVLCLGAPVRLRRDGNQQFVGPPATSRAVCRRVADRFISGCPGTTAPAAGRSSIGRRRRHRPAGATGATGPVNPCQHRQRSDHLEVHAQVPTPGSGTTTSTLYSANGSRSSPSATARATRASCERSVEQRSELTVSGESNGGTFGSQTNNLGASSNATLDPRIGTRRSPTQQLGHVLTAASATRRPARSRPTPLRVLRHLISG